MTQRLVWNFEFAKRKLPPPVLQEAYAVEDLKWEIRFFWPQDYIITLHALENSQLDLMSYQLKHREEYYFLLPGAHYNIKERRGELLFKPILKRSKQAIGFGSKIALVENNDPTFQEILNTTQQEGQKILVNKEVFVYKFNTTPSVKLELARLEINKQIFFSACIEGRSLYLVETISEYLLDTHLSCDYVSFLKNIINYD